MFVLLAGMAFQSSVLIPGSAGYTFLTALVVIVLVMSVLTFMTLLLIEVCGDATSYLLLLGGSIVLQ